MEPKNKVVYIPRAFFPVYIGFVPSEAAWKKEMKLFKLSEPYPTTSGRVTFLENKEGKCVCLVTINEEWDNDGIAISCLLAHETVHVFQTICKEMGEENPSPEFEAYSVQYILHHLLEAFYETRGKENVS